MGANTKWYVEVYKMVKEVAQISAIDRVEAREEAESIKGVCFTGDIYHWSEFEED